MASCTWGVAAAAGAAASAEVFGYNRENYLYDRKMRMETEYTIMDMRIKKTGLWREDVKDIVALTAIKMDTYLIVNAVQLGFVVMAFCEGRLAPGTPVWLVGAHTLCMGAAFAYYLLSVYFAMHATVASKSFEVRILTQWVRLPIPSWAQIEGCRTYASTFEKTDARQMFRVPFVTGKQEDVLEGSKSAADGGSRSHDVATAADQSDGKFTEDAVVNDVLDDSAGSSKEARSASAGTTTPSNDPWGLERPGGGIYELESALQADVRKLRHIQLVREALKYWQAYDGFARVAMSVGTKELVTGMAYYVLGYALASNHAIVAAWLAVVVFMSIVWGIISVDMSLTWPEYLIAVPIYISAPSIMAFCVKVWAQDGQSAEELPLLIPIAFLIQFIGVLFLLYALKVKEQHGGLWLPTGYRSVLYLDVFGWIHRNTRGATSTNKLSTLLEEHPISSSTGASCGHGPALESIHYAENGQAVPLRPEQLPGAARQFGMFDITRKDYMTTTFVPCEAESQQDADGQSDKDAEPDVGGRPWKIFKTATVTLAILWFFSGVLVGLELWGATQFKVQPLLVEPSARLDASRVREDGGLLQFGRSLNTTWPMPQVRPVGMSCNGVSNTVLVSSRFALYATSLDQSSLKGKLDFGTAPLCDHIQGEMLQDVALDCSENKPCKSVVLHSHGTKISSFDLEAWSANSSLERHATWISEENIPSGTSVKTLAIGQRCHNRKDDCIYIGTSSKLIIEFRKALQASQEWLAVDTLKAASLASDPALSTHGISMHMIGGNFLGILQADGKHLEVLDLQRQGFSRIWRLPEGKSFSAMCATDNALYFIEKALSPQLWHFPLPDQLKARNRESKQDKHLQSVPSTAEASVALLEQTRPLLHIAPHMFK